MDNLEQRLAEDAARIEARVSPELEARIKAALRAERVAPAARREVSYPLWLAASLTGAAAAVVAIVLVNLAPNFPNEPSPARADAVAYSVPEYVSEFERQFPLRAKTAQMTTPLEDELKKLRSDLEKARENVEQDLEFTF
ncbi:MAG: hypothetical protein ACREQ1_13505 [Woeseiaceae bacterium]